MNINKRFVPAYIWGACIFTLSSIPYLETPGLKGIGVDLLAHCGVYLILGVLVFRVDAQLPKRLPYISIIVFAIIDELHQVFVPGRCVEYADLMANFSGIFCARLIMYRQGIKTLISRTWRENGNIQKTTASQGK